ncbi:MAG: M56 family metallopeptidase [Anaerovoracaceae bacterium]
MGRFFLDVVNMSIGASCVILVVLLLRLALRRAPKKFSYLLWSVVGLRLCCPVSFSSVFSLFQFRPIQHVFSPGNAGTSPVFLPEVNEVLKSAADAGYGAIAIRPETGEDFVISVSLVFQGIAAVWITGMLLLLLLGAVNYLRLKKRLAASVRREENVWQSDQVCSPFILGILKPKIFIPFGLEGESLSYVLAHERVHIRRADHLVKLLAFLLVTVHWFNPLVWLAFHLMTKDMEMSCDEKVLEELGVCGKKNYSMSLLSFAANRRFPAPGPLAFGETAVKSRIKNVLNWRKPKRWISVCATMACLVMMAACAANPVEPAAIEPNLAADEETRDYFEYAASFTEELIGRYRGGDWDDLAADFGSGILLIKEGQKGYYDISGLHLASDYPEACAGVAIRQMEDGPVWLSAVLLQRLDYEKGGVELQIQIDADISNPGQPEMIDCTLTVQKGVAASQTKILEYSYKDLNLSENLLQDVVICINNSVPRLAAMQAEAE